MKHKPNLLFVGFHDQADIDPIDNCSFTKCESGVQAIDLFVQQTFDIVISRFQLKDSSAIELNQSLQSLQSNSENNSRTRPKFLVVSSSVEEENACKKAHLLFYPEQLNLRSLILRLINLPKEPKQTNQKAAVINFKELFIRVDNNRSFIGSVIEEFFKVWESRTNEMKQALATKDFATLKNLAHKLKGVLANFSMEKARLCIIDLEQLIKEEEYELCVKKLEELIEKIKEAYEFYKQNRHQFTD